MSAPKFIKVMDSSTLDREMAKHPNTILLFTLEGCPHCDSLKEALKELDFGENPPEVIEVPYDKRQTFDLFKDLDIDMAPSAYLIKECTYQGKVVGDTEDVVEAIGYVYQDAKNACRLEDGSYAPMEEAVVVTKDDEDE